MSVVLLDVGKSNVKLVALDSAGRATATRTRPNVIRPGPPYPHVDVDGIWDWVTATLATLPGRSEVTAIVPVAHGCAAVLLAGEELALPVLDYEHDGPEATAEGYRANADAFGDSFTPDLPLGQIVAAQFWWQRQRFPAAFARATAILTWPQYWAWRLCGVMATEFSSLGAHSGTWQPGQRAFGALATREGWAALMAPRRSAWDSLGPPRAELARASGLDPACRVICGAHDSNASFLAHRAHRAPPFSVVSTGTWTIVMAAGASLDRLRADRDMLANVDVFGDPLPTARFMGGREWAAVAGAGAAPASLSDAAAVLASGALALPSFVAGSGPFPHRTGAVIGDPPSRPALASLYLALVVDVMLDLLGARPPCIVEGPAATDVVFGAALAALRDGEVILSHDATGTAAGAMALAGWGGAMLAPVAGRVATPLAGMAEYRERWRAALLSPP